MKHKFTFLGLLIICSLSLGAQSLNCFNLINVSLDMDGNAYLSPDMVLEGSMGDFDTIYIEPDFANCDDLGEIEYTVYGEATNGLMTSCTGIIFLEDKLAPIAIGDLNVTVTLNANGEYTFTGSDLDDGSWDNCGPVSFSWSPAILTCDDVSPTNVTLIVEDESGNTNQVVANVFIDYNNPSTIVCDALGTLNVLGGPVEITPEDVLEGGTYNCLSMYFTTCTDLDGNPVSCTFDISQVGNTYNVQVTDFISGTSCWSDVTIVSEEQPFEICVNDFEVNPVKDVELIWGTTTAENGCAEILSGPGAQIAPILMDDPLNGVDDIDLLIIREGILSINPLIGEQMLAADVNKNGSVTSLDLILIEKAMLGEFAFNESWIFVDGDYEFPDNVFPSNYNEYITLGSESNYEFVGIKVGDVDLSYEQLISDDDKEVLAVNDIVLNQGETYFIDISMKEAADLVVANVQFPAETSEYKVVNITSKMSTYTFDAEADITNNIARFRWLGIAEAEFGGVNFEEDEPLFTIEIEALSNGILSQTFELSNNSQSNRWKKAALTQGNHLKLEYQNIITVPTVETDVNEFTLTPNPVKGQMLITHESLDFDKAEFIITDISGKRVKNGSFNGNATIDVTDLHAGLYSILMHVNGERTTPQMFVKN
ncbi:T9SS type A sorting domain-containing protein [Saprospiraceae bacterium]|nr:T9SS type A sorting domain-containing protein [Saprospiraceae bacterium]